MQPDNRRLRIQHPQITRTIEIKQNYNYCNCTKSVAKLSFSLTEAAKQADAAIIAIGGLYENSG
jgi:hypothetical protein